ncbi:hypothetical protein PT281_07560 [Lactobacillus sp. ESL0701]|uniref:hypothetical protein n=1 Tax=Lactobacillus sp. ESL0701 TaxID=2983217 RepID=UPI0023F8DAFA|nr:hypothetical protein [Lactobacillus sp. ESL0701]MDF7673116.1 hypothetical protein [Lactobacillus sp. ESL0701]
MNKKFAFYIYAAATSLLIILARENWTLYLSTKKLWQLNFAWLGKPFVFSLLSANILFFDCLSIWLPRSNFDSISDLVMVRQPNLKNLIINVIPYIWQYFLIFVLVHVIAFSGSITRSIIMLAVMICIWLILLFLPNYRCSLNEQRALVFVLLLGLRLFTNQFV